jgi:NADH-quinone oxidoreductase subunit L
LFLFAMQGLVVAPNLLQLFICWELVGLCSYLLIGFYYQKPAAARAALKAFWMTKFADMGLLLGLILQFSVTRSFGWDQATVQALIASSWALPWVAGLYFLAVMGKSAQFPLHVWLPDAMEGPTPVSALLHAATMVAAGVYLIVRSFPIFEAAESIHLYMTYIGATTALMAACIAMVQTDIKKVLAYSTCSQLGYMISALGAGSMMAGYFHLTTHAFFKALLFLAAGSIIHAVHTNDMREMGGLWKKMPFTSLVFIIGSMALAGIPIFSGFYSKDLILETLYARSLEDPLFFPPFLACVLGAGLTAYYMTRTIIMTFFGKLSRKSDYAHEHGWRMSAPLLLLAILAITAGFGADTFAHLIGETHFHFAIFHFSPVALLALCISLSGIVLGYLIHVRGDAAWIAYALMPVKNFIEFGPVNQAWLSGYRHGLLGISASIAWFDRYIVDGLLNWTGAMTLIAGDRLRMMQTGRVSDYVYVVVFGAILLAAWGQMWLGPGAS